MKQFYLSVTEICNAISESLFEPVNKIAYDMRCDLIAENNKVVKGNYEGFKLITEFYTTRDIGTEVYQLPELDESLLPKFEEIQNFIRDSKDTLLKVGQFIKQNLFFALDNSSFDEEGQIDLAEVLPQKLLSVTKLKYDYSINCKTPPALAKEWEKYNPLLNKLLALRIVL